VRVCEPECLPWTAAAWKTLSRPLWGPGSPSHLAMPINPPGMSGALVFCWVWEGSISPANKPLLLRGNNLLGNSVILLIFFLLSFTAHVTVWLMGLRWVGGQQTHMGEVEERL